MGRLVEPYSATYEVSPGRRRPRRRGAVLRGVRRHGRAGARRSDSRALDALIATRGALSGAPTTARLVVDYRLPVPLPQTLRMEAVVDKMDGRKCHMSARMLDGEVLLAEATALTLAPRP